ncbi:MAG TPA: FG-GAP repeat protein, partial [Acidimicrobiales bacterium]
SALAAGDLNGDPDDLPELVVGVPFESVGTVPDAGAAHVLPGSVGDGPLAAGSLLLHQDVGSIGSTAEAFDQFGAAFAIADLDGDGLAELTVGVPGESVGDVQQAGAVNVISGTTGPVIHQDVSGVPSTAEEGDVFGAALAAAP